MKLFGWQCLAVSSILLAALAASARDRPQYGGTLHVSMREVPVSLEPWDTTQPDSFAGRNVTLLIFETLTTIADNGRVTPGLATSWQATEGDQRWQFHLRAGVNFHDGAAVSSQSVAASLRNANPAWKITADADQVFIECESPHHHLLQELALPRNAIAKKTDDGRLSGTGPFHIAEWQPGKKLMLTAEENYWGGRPFLGAIEIEFGKDFREQLLAQELGKADLIEISPEQLHRVSGAKHSLSSSQPVELMALHFAHDARSPEEKSLREALSLSIDRRSMESVILQSTGYPAGSILPNWMSGYAFLFTTDADLARARHLREQAHDAASWTISYEASDPLAHLLAERIALNARDAGLPLQPTRNPSADLRIVTIPLPSDPSVALDEVSVSLGAPVPTTGGDSMENLYAAERALLATQRVIPLFHLPVVYSASPSLRGWETRFDGTYNLAESWMTGEQPDKNPTGKDQP